MAFLHYKSWKNVKRVMAVGSQWAHLVHLIECEAPVGLRPDRPERNFTIWWRLTKEHVVQREVMADGILQWEMRKKILNVDLNSDIWILEFVMCYYYPFLYLPSRFGHLSEVREVVLDPCVNLFQRHPPVLPAVDGKLDHGHVGVRWPLWLGLLNSFCIHLLILCLCKKRWKKKREAWTDVLNDPISLNMPWWNLNGHFKI